jgi:hypothetical protein
MHAEYIYTIKAYMLKQYACEMRHSPSTEAAGVKDLKLWVDLRHTILQVFKVLVHNPVSTNPCSYLQSQRIAAAHTRLYVDSYEYRRVVSYSTTGIMGI